MAASSQEKVGPRLDAEVLRSKRSRSVLYEIIRRPGTLVSSVFLLLLIIAAVLGKTIAPYDVLRSEGVPLSGPSSQHLLGTDGIGRDVFSRVIVGLRPTVASSIAVLVISVITGTAVGIISAVLGGWVDLVIQRLVDGVMAFPPLVLALLLSAVIGPQVKWDILWTVVLALSVLVTPGIVRVVRATAISERSRDHVGAARVLGATEFRVMFVHVLPGVVPIILTLGALQVGFMVVAEASLSFLGAGMPPPNPSLGRMIADQRQFWVDAPWLAVAPIGVLALIVLSANLFADGLRDLIDPRRVR